LGSKAKELQRELDGLKQRAALWAEENLKRLADSEPECPPQFSDRQEDIGEPLLAIADSLGGSWPARSREALITLFASPAAEDASHRVRLLADIKEIYEISEADRFSSEDLVQKLAEIETSPWGEWKNSKPMTQRGLAAQLKPFEVYPRKIRFDAYTTKNGYLRDWFAPLWKRYVPDKNDERSGSKITVSANVYAVCSPVPDKLGSEREYASEDALFSEEMTTL